MSFATKSVIRLRSRFCSRHFYKLVASDLATNMSKSGTGACRPDAPFD
jgi:hypothetical protein